MAILECAEETRHRARRTARIHIEEMLLDYQQQRGLSDLDMLCVLSDIARTTLRYIDRNDEERRTGFRHRLAGE
jgi:hypothetical protein